MTGAPTSFSEFWPYYVSRHSRASTRWVHLAGTAVGAAIGIHGVLSGHPRRLVALPTLRYSLAWGSHLVLERNHPVTRGGTLWYLLGDAKMFTMMATGQDAKLTRLAAATA